MTKARPDPDREDAPLVDLRAFVLIASAAAVGIVLYLAPAVGVALLGSLSALAVLVRLVGRSR